MPRKTAKKPTTKKTAARKTAPKRKAYQTGGAAKTMRPGTMQSMPLATGQRMATAPAQTSSQEAERKRQEMIRRDRAMMEVGNRQRAAAFEAARKRAAAQAARTQRPVQGPSRAQAARNRAEYEAAMRARTITSKSKQTKHGKPSTNFKSRKCCRASKNTTTDSSTPSKATTARRLVWQLKRNRQ